MADTDIEQRLAQEDAERREEREKALQHELDTDQRIAAALQQRQGPSDT